MRLCPLSAVLRARLMSHVWLMARSEQLRQLPVQLPSLPSLEDVVTHGLQSSLESPSRLVAPISSVEQVLPAASIPLVFSLASRLRSAKSAWAHWSVRHELPFCSSRPLVLHPLPLWPPSAASARALARSIGLSTCNMASLMGSGGEKKDALDRSRRMRICGYQFACCW